MPCTSRFFLHSKRGYDQRGNQPETSHNVARECARYSMFSTHPVQCGSDSDRVPVCKGREYRHYAEIRHSLEPISISEGFSMGRLISFRDTRTIQPALHLGFRQSHEHGSLRTPPHSFQGDSVANYSARSTPAIQSATNAGTYSLTLHYTQVRSTTPPPPGGQSSH